MKEDNENINDDLDTFDEIDMFLKKKYDEIVVPKSMFDTTKVFERYRKEQEKKKKTIRVASILVIVFMVCIAVGVHLTFNKNTGKIDNIGTVDNDGNNSNENSEPNIVGNISIKPYKRDGYENRNLEIFCTIQVQDILGYEMVEGIPSTKLKVKVLKNYLKDVEGEVVEMIVPGGVFTVKEIKASNELEYNEELKKYKEDEKLNVTCYDIMYIPIAEVGKTYVATLNMNNGMLQVASDRLYGFKEYDAENNTIKEIDGSWSKIDIEDYLSDKI